MFARLIRRYGPRSLFVIRLMSKMAVGCSTNLRSPIFTKPAIERVFFFAKRTGTVATADKVRVLSVWYLVGCAFRKVVLKTQKPQGVNLRACLFGCSVRFCSEHTQNVLLQFCEIKLFRKINLNIMPLVEIPSQFRASSHKRFLNREHFHTRQPFACMTGYPFQ